MNKTSPKTNQLRQKGQSLAELMVGMAAILPIVLLIPVIGGYLNLDFQSNQASRHAAWATTVYSDLPDPTNSNSLNGTARQLQIQLQTMQAFFRHPLNGFGLDVNTSQNNLWVDADGVSGKRARMLENINGNEQTTATSLDLKAYSDADKTGINNTSSFAALANVFQTAQDSAGNSIKANNFYSITLKVPLNLNSPSMKEAASLTGALPLEDGKLYKTSKAAIIANTWVPQNEAYYRKVVCRNALASASKAVCEGTGNPNAFSNTALELAELGIPRFVKNVPALNWLFPEMQKAILGNYNMVPTDQSQLTAP